MKIPDNNQILKWKYNENNCGIGLTRKIITEFENF